MSGLGLTLSDDIYSELEELNVSSESKSKTFQYFNYPSKIKEKPFSSVDYSLDEQINIILQEPQTSESKYDKIIEGQEKLIDLLKQENSSLKQKNEELESTVSNYPHSQYTLAQEILPICYLLQLDINSQYVYTEIYHSIENLLNQLTSNQKRIVDLEKRVKVKQPVTPRVNSSTYVEKPQAKDNRSKRGVVQYREKEEVEYISKLEKQIKVLKQQCVKLKTAPPAEPLFIASVKQKKVEIIVQKIVEKVVERIVEVEKIVTVEKIIEKPVIIEKIIEKPIYFEKKVKEEVPIYIEKVIEKPAPIYIDREIEIQKIVYLRQSTGSFLVSNYTQTQN